MNLKKSWVFMFNFSDSNKIHEEEKERSPSLELESNNEAYDVIYFKAKKVIMIIIYSNRL